MQDGIETRKSPYCVNNGAKIIKLLQRSEQISESDGWIDIVDGNRRYGGRCVVGVFVFLKVTLHGGVNVRTYICL